MFDRKNALADLGLLAAAGIGGAGVYATGHAIEAGLTTGAILLLRLALSALVLGAVCWKQVVTVTGREWADGALPGLFLFLALFLQTEALSRTAPLNCALWTAASVAVTPALAWAAARRRPARKDLVLPLLAAAGLAVLGNAPGLSLGAGAGLALGGALFFACHIVSLEGAAKRVEAQKLAFVQLTTAAGLALLYFLLVDRSPAAGGALRAGFLPMLYLGLLGTCACVFLQTAAQRRAGAVRAALFLSTQGAFAALLPVLLGLQAMQGSLAAGGGLLFACAALSALRLPPRAE